jgi:dienelactone hydrolase
MIVHMTFWSSARFVAAATLVALGAGVGVAQAQDVVADFSAAPPSGKYAFASWTPKTLTDIFTPPAQHDVVNIVGHLFLPPGNAKVPAIVLMHGSGGIYQAMLEYWPQQFNAAGYAVLSVDSFGPRGVSSTADDQSLVPFAADIADAFAALKVLAAHPRIDAKRIAIMGFSRGGITAWRTAVERIIAAQKLPPDLRFAAHIEMYAGGCAGVFRLIVKPGVFAKEPMLWIHGEADDYTPIAPCQAYAGEIGKAGTPVEFVAIPGAYHKFDLDDQKRVVLRTAQKTKAECPIEIDIDTLYAYDRTTGKRIQGEEFRDVLKSSCSATGATTQGWFGARDKADQAALAFLKKVFGQ